MRTTIFIDDKLMDEVLEVTGARSRREAVDWLEGERDIRNCRSPPKGPAATPISDPPRD